MPVSQPASSVVVRGSERRMLRSEEMGEEGEIVDGGEEVEGEEEEAVRAGEGGAVDAAATARGVLAEVVAVVKEDSTVCVAVEV